MEKARETFETSEELLREQKIEAELDRIGRYFETMDENQKAIISPLVQNSAFMRVTLEELQQKITEEGVVEQYQNGANQFGMKQSAALQSYNTLVKNYASVTKQLFSLLPAEKKTAAPVWQRKPEPTEEEKEAERLQKEKEYEDAAAQARELLKSFGQI